MSASGKKISYELCMSTCLSAQGTNRNQAYNEKN